MEISVLKITKRDGRIVEFNTEKIVNAIFKAAVAVGGQDRSLAEQLAKKVIDMANEQFDGHTIPNVEQVQDIVEKVLIEEGHAKTAKAYIIYRQKRAQIREAKAMLGVKDELKLPLNAITVLEKRYLKKDKDGEVIETPSELFRRVADNVSQAEKLYNSDVDSTKIANKFFNMISSLEFMPNSPTLMNAGTDMQQLSACFVLPIEDDMTGIFDSVKHTALIHQSGGGTGFSFSRVRPKGDRVKSTMGVASGPLSFMKVFNTATEVVKQGGRRRGANMGMMRIDHPDILDFIVAKEREGELNNFNLSVAITDKFMNAVEKDEDFELINPRTGEIMKKVNARRVFNLIVTLAWKNGEPGVVFIDKINQNNPTPEIGLIESTNPCVVGDTLVSTNKGLISIKELAEDYNGMNVITDNRTMVENGNTLMLQKGVSMQGITQVIKTGIKDTFKIITKSGYELTATKDHKILTTTGWKELGNLSIEDYVLIQSGYGKFGKDKRIHNNVSYAKEWSKELGQILGLLVGDGWLKEGKNCRVGFTFGNNDSDVLDYIKPKINKLYGKEIKEIIRKDTVTHLSYHSKDFVEFFKKLGVKPVRASEKEVPMSLLSATEEAVTGFLQGLFTADGTIATNNNKNTNYIRLTSKSEKLLKGTQILLLNLGIKSRIYERHRNKRITFKYKTVRGEMRLYESDGILFELQISKNMIPVFLSKIGFICKKNKDKIEHLEKINFYNTKFEDRIVSIEPQGQQEVYDLTEPVTHSFIANGIVVHNCGEQPLLPYESCNLGSINLVKMLRKQETGYCIDWEKLKDTVKWAVRFLDNVVDMNKYPLEEIKNMTKANRKIGLGLMGFADMLIKMGVPYNSDEGVATADEIMKVINEEGHKASIELAEERGVFPNWEKSMFKKMGVKMRNATVTTIAPTGTISIIAGCSSGIEPLFAISYVRRGVLDGQTELLEVNPLFEEMARLQGFYSDRLMKEIARKGTIQNIEGIPDNIKKIFVTSMDIAPEWHVMMQATFQKHTDNAVSKTVNFPFSATTGDVEKVYLLSYQLNCKGITIYRDGSRDVQVLNIEREPLKDGPKPDISKFSESLPKASGLTKENDMVTVDAEYAGGCSTCHI